MRTTLDRDHDLLGEEVPPSDLVLGMPALLGVFFAVALICAVCFGFGYSSGHGLHLTAQGASSTAKAPSGISQQKPPTPATQPEDGELASTLQDSRSSTAQAPPFTAEVAAKPAPGTSLPAQRQGVVAETTPSATTTVPLATRPTDAERPTSAMRESTHFDDRAAPVKAASTAPAGGAPLNLMVQIAAVTHAADAETLSTALRHDGFSAIVRTTTGDPFFHVQVGPFASREQAKAMRARLAASGYNAFIKQ